MGAFLEHGVNSNGVMLHVSQVTSGMTSLGCPYCGGQLVARKGQQLVHHFAHAGETCRQADRDFDGLTLPLWDKFNLFIDSQTWAALQRFYNNDRRASSHTLNKLLNHDPQLIRDTFNPRNYNYELTHEGGIPFGETTLQSFADVQQSFVSRRHNELKETVQRAFSGRDHMGYAIGNPDPVQAKMNLVDLNIYRAQIRRFYSLDLYLLEIQHTQGTLHKIGVTGRNIDDRIVEIKRDLSPFVTVEKIKPLRLLSGRGAVERYALHRFNAHKVQVGNLTEYFQFETGNRVGQLGHVKSEFTRLGDLPIVDRDQWYAYGGQMTKGALLSQILAGDPSDIETDITDYERVESHRQATVEGMQRAAQQGVHVGRPEGTTETPDDFLNKYPEVVQCLRRGLSLRKTSKETGVSRNTVIKVKRKLDDLTG